VIYENVTSSFNVVYECLIED